MIASQIQDSFAHESFTGQEHDAPTLVPSDKPEFPDLTVTPPDSIRLTIRLGSVTPTSTNTIPGALTSGMTRELASHVAVELNRQAIEGSRFPDHWHVVAHCKTGFAVVRLLRPENWTPATEYETPPSAECGMMNAPARMEVKKFNRLQMTCGTQFWQLLVKPLDYPRVVERATLSEAECEVVERLSVALGTMLHVQKNRNGEMSMQVLGMPAVLRWDAEKQPVSNFAETLRNIAQRFQTAADAIEGKESPARLTVSERVSLASVLTTERQLAISGIEGVRFVVSDARDDDEAFLKAREAAAALSR